MISVYELRQKYPEVSEMWPEDSRAFLESLVAYGDLSPEEYAEWSRMMEAVEAEELTPIEQLDKLRAEVTQAWYEKMSRSLIAGFDAVLKSFWSWLRENIFDFFQRIWDWTKAKLQELWEWIKQQFRTLAEAAYSSILSQFTSHSPITPELAPKIAGGLFALATASGMSAHGLASLTEAGHPYKNLGLQYSAGFLGELAGWNRISQATLGVYMSRVLGQAMTYYVQNQHRPILPDDKLLQIMAVKPDITLEEFRQGMAYQGYSDTWIDAIMRTMYREPRYFELKMMAEDEAATPEWLFLKSRRGGYTEADSKIYVSSFIKAATRTQRLDYYRQGFYLYKEGYISKEEFDAMLDELEVRPEAKAFCVKAAQLAYLNDYIRDMIGYYTDSFMKDVIDEEELLVSLVGLGIISDRAWLLTAKAKIRKRPKPRLPVPVTAAKATGVVQAKYVTLYTTQYRKDLIDQETFLSELLQLGITPDLAQVTVAIEAAKKGVLLAG